MTCHELIDFLIDYLSGELPAEQRTVFDRHLGVCPECVAYLQTYLATIQVSKAACHDARECAAGPLPERLVQAILAARPRQG